MLSEGSHESVHYTSGTLSRLLIGIIIFACMKPASKHRNVISVNYTHCRNANPNTMWSQE